MKEIGFSDTKIVQDKDGEPKEVLVFIPECCREGFESCPHVVKPYKPKKRNIGL